MNDFARQWAEIGPDALRAVDAVGRSGWYILGERVQRFEAALSQFWQIPFSAGVASGLDALEVALCAAGLQPGDRVLTTPLSAFATTLAIVRAGGVPVFCDTDQQGLIDLAEARRALEAMPGIRFFLPVHLYGFPLNPLALRLLIKDFQLICVEDCAQSIGARHAGHPTGSSGVAAATSFYPTKNLGAMGDGGALLSADKDLIERARRLRDYGQSAKYHHTEIGWNSRLDEVHAAILDEVLLPRLERWTQRRRQIAQRYLDHWSSSRVRPLTSGEPRPDSWLPSWHLFPVRTDSKHKAGLIKHLQRAGILTGEHYPVLIPEQRALSGVPYARFGDLPNAQSLAAEELSLPIHPFMTDAEIDRVLAALAAWDAAGPHV